jgi:ribonuclease J
MNITIFGGVSTIGGNCIIVEEKNTRIMLDNGMCFSRENLYYKDFLKPRTNNDLRDYFNLDLIPKIPGIYGKEKIVDVCYDNQNQKSRYLFECNLKSYKEYLKKKGKPYVSALFLTHAHLDHARNIIFMAPEIPIYCSKITKRFLRIIKDLSNYNLLEYSFHELKQRTGSSYFPNCIYKDKNYQKRVINSISPFQEVKIPKSNTIFFIKGFPVDHSIPGAMAFEITTKSGKRLIYTGDLRFHGHQHEKIQSEEFLNRVKSNTDVLIIEGTRVSDNKEVSENDVHIRMLKLLKADQNLSTKLIIATFPWKSISRLLTVYKVAKNLNRMLVIQPKLAYTISNLQHYDSLKIAGLLESENIKIYLPRKYGMTYSQDDYTNTKYHISPDTNWSRDEEIDFYSSIYEENILVKAYDIKENPEKYLLHLNFYELNELIDIQPPKNSYFFNLKTEPFDEEGELEEKVLLSWLSKFELDFKKDYYHASGHAPESDLRMVINKVNPKLIIPVHTENPKWFLKNYKNSLIPEEGKKYEI